MTNTVYQTVTDKIVAAIEAGAGEWKMPWHTAHAGGATVQPVNIDGRRYRGANVITLWAEAQIKGYTAPMWGTYKAWQSCGGQVRKGEKATTIVFWKSFKTTVVDPDSGDELTHLHLFARGYSVFNLAQIDGYQPTIAAPSDRPLVERIAHAESFFGAIPVPVAHGGDRAFYIPSADPYSYRSLSNSTTRKRTTPPAATNAFTPPATRAG